MPVKTSETDRLRRLYVDQEMTICCAPGLVEGLGRQDSGRALAPLQTDRLSKFENVLAEVVVTVGKMVHQVGQPVRDRVELVLDGFVGPVLAVLQQRDHEKGDDRRGRVDDELPGVDVLEEEVAGRPNHYQRNAGNEEGRAAGEPGARSGETIEDADVI